jgi:uncharacterized membrane protein
VAPAVITSSAPPFAITLGALVSGALVEYGPSPRVLGFAATTLMLAVLAVLIVLCPETASRRPGFGRSLVPRVHVPAGAGRVLLSTGCALVATWSFSGFYQAFAPGLTTDIVAEYLQVSYLPRHQQRDDDRGGVLGLVVVAAAVALATSRARAPRTSPETARPTIE